MLGHPLIHDLALSKSRFTMSKLAAITCIRKQKRIASLAVKYARHFVGLILALTTMVVLAGNCGAQVRSELSDPRTGAPEIGTKPIDTGQGERNVRRKELFFLESGGIREVVPEKYYKRYLSWKEEFRSTETGRRQWDMYAHDSRFTLTLVISCHKRNGAETGQFSWDDDGKLTAATINLGCRIDKGYPGPVNTYPVTHSLEVFESLHVKNNGRILAAAKLAHEFGHLSRANKDGVVYQLQNQLIPVYLRVFRTNGYNTSDPRLIELAQQMGGTSVQIWEDREYSAEANAWLYLSDKIQSGAVPCSLFNQIKENVESHAKSLEGRFLQIAESKSTPACRASKKQTQLEAKR